METIDFKPTPSSGFFEALFSSFFKKKPRAPGFFGLTFYKRKEGNNMKKILPLLALLLTACLFEKEDKDEPRTHTLTLSGKLSDLRSDKNNFAYWFLNVDSLVPGYTTIWENTVCDGEGYLGDSASTNYTNQYMKPSSVYSEYIFVVPDTALARGFTHYRLEILCPDSVNLPPKAS